MATYTVTHKQVLDNYAVIATLQPNEITVGQTFTVAGMGAPYDGAQVAYALPQYLFTGTSTQGDLNYDPAKLIPNQLLFKVTASNVDRVAATGTVTFTELSNCTWITISDLEDYLGFTIANPSSDYDYATICVGAANAYAYRKRREAGYFDSSLSTVPSQDVKLGTMIYAGQTYKSRSSIDQFASYEQMTTAAPVGSSMGEIMRLLGVNRPAVA